MGNDKKMGTLTKNDKITTNNNMVWERHIETLRALGSIHDFFLFCVIRGTKMLRVEGIGYNVGGHQKYIKGLVGIRDKSIIYIIHIYFKPKVVGKHGKKGVEACRKGPKKILLKQ
jgi:hypothetical protein